MKNKNLVGFCYSQNSINTYKSCPLKFKYKYIDYINWEHDDIESRSYYDNLKLGRDFHLVCERYFSNIPLGIDEKNKEKFTLWMDRIQKVIPYENSKLFLPEYEIRTIINNEKIQAKFDLLVINNNEVDIWDWKTEIKEIDYKKVENRLQTIVYMYMVKEVISDLFNIEDIKVTMNYYQPEFMAEPVKIEYDNFKHIKNKENLTTYIEKIRNTNYDTTVKENENSLKNKNHCKYCEFNKLCNKEEVNFDRMENEAWDLDLF